MKQRLIFLFLFITFNVQAQEKLVNEFEHTSNLTPSQHIKNTESKEEDDFDFTVNADEVESGKIQHYVEVNVNATVRRLFKEAGMDDFDRNNSLKRDGANIIEKYAYVVNGKSVNFFKANVFNQDYISKSLNNLTINSQKSQTVFAVTTKSEGSNKIDYDLQIDHYNVVKTAGEEAGTLEKEYVEMLLNADKNLGVPQLITTETMLNPSDTLNGAYTIKKYYPFNQGKDTLIVTYSFSNIKTSFLRPLKAIRYFVMKRPHANKKENIVEFKKYLLGL